MNKLEDLKGPGSSHHSTDPSKSAAPGSSPDSSQNISQKEQETLDAAAVFADRLNNVQAILIERCMAIGEREEAFKQARNLLTKPFISYYHCGIANIALATLCLPVARAGKRTVNIELHLRDALDAFAAAREVLRVYRTGATGILIGSDVDIKRLESLEAQAGLMLQDFRQWKLEREKARREAESSELKDRMGAEQK